MWQKKEKLDHVSVNCKVEVTDPSCENPHDADSPYEWCEDATPAAVGNDLPLVGSSSL